MHASLLAKHGLANLIAGADYNFRYATAGNQFARDMERALEALAIQPKETYTGQQVHGTNIAYADGTCGEDFVFGKTFKETDGLITDQPLVALLVKYADCTPIVLYDPVKGVQSSLHSGWRGTVQQISQHALEMMERDFGCRRENILAYLGPSIDQDNYEVGPEVYDAFRAFPDRDQFFKPKGAKYLLSMLDANLALLKEAGLQQGQIEVERTSTYTDPRLHSARQESREYQLNGILTMMLE